MTESRVLYDGCVAGTPWAWNESSAYAATAILSKFDHPKIPLDDLVAEVRLHLADGGLAKVRNPDGFKTFLWKTAINVARSRLRLKHVAQEYVADSDDPVTDPIRRTPADRISIDRHVYREQIIQQALERLRPRERELILQRGRYLADGEFSYEDMMEVMQMKRGHLAGAAYRALQRFRAILVELEHSVVDAPG